MHKIKIKIGEIYSLPLDQLGTAGYSWNFTIEEGNTVITITQHGLTVPPVPGTKSTIPGTYEAKLEFAIQGIKPGVAKVKFFLHRVWEKNKPFLKEKMVYIEVEK